MNESQRKFGEPNPFVRGQIKGSLDAVEQEFDGRLAFLVFAGLTGVAALQIVASRRNGALDEPPRGCCGLRQRPGPS